MSGVIEEPLVMALDWGEALIWRTQRSRSLSIRIKNEAVHVKMPQHVSLSEVRDLLDKKTSWIQANLQRQQTALAAVKKTCQAGELFCFMGKHYPLCIQPADTTKVSISQNNQLIVCSHDVSPKAVYTCLLDWYQQQALYHLTQQTHALAGQLGYCPSSLRIKSYRSKWGSCSNAGAINYNWRLIMAPVDIMRYVIAHELCHLIEMNHSPKFWQLVATLDGDYKAHRLWLKQHGEALDLQLVKA